MAYKLLLADDSVTIQRVIELTFADEDIQVIAVGDGRQAIERIAAEPPDIVLADVGMPERDGFEVASFVKQNPQLSRIPVLLLTGAFEPVDEARVRAVGCDGVLAKPFEPQLLIAKVKELLARPMNAPNPSPSAPEVPAVDARLDDQPVVLAPDEPASAALDALTLSPDNAADSRASVDEYFDRLDAAFAGIAGAPPPSTPNDVLPVPPADRWEPPDAAGTWASPIVPGEDEAVAMPGQDLASAGAPLSPAWNPQVVSAAPADVASPAFAPAGAVGVASPHVLAPAIAGAPPEIAAAFDLLLAAEQGQSMPVDVRRSAPASPSPSVAFDAIVDEVTRRVIERLADRGVQEQVADIVSQVAERLVRAEIERLKSGLK